MRIALALTAAAAAVFAGGAVAAPVALEPVKGSGSTSMIMSFSVNDRTFAPTLRTTGLSLTTTVPARFSLTVAGADGSLWWGTGGKTEGYKGKTISWAGRSTRGKGIAKPGVYNVRLVVVNSATPDEAHTFTSTWQVRVMPRKP